MKMTILSITLAFAGGLSVQAHTFDTLGAMIDVSRGRVLKVDYLKGRFDRMRKMGCQTLSGK